ncbi:MAG: 50S ribosomal protein L30 [Bacteroidota bacterium]|jgi:ribosomal protein L30, bacterial/organelle|nr:50S ribosomal protein L30 [Bacteroidota bacterium]
MAKIKITQTKGLSGHTKRQRETLKALGLRKTNSTVEKEATPAIVGMVEKVKHLVVVENI